MPRMWSSYQYSRGCSQGRNHNMPRLRSRVRDRFKDRKRRGAEAGRDSRRRLGTIMVQLCIIYDKVRFEEKALYEKAQKKGVKAQIVDGKTLTITTDSKKKDFTLGDVIMQRSVSHYRGLYLTACLEF